MWIKRMFLRVIVIFSIITVINRIQCNAEVNTLNTNKILIIASYSVDNEWENSIINGFKQSIGNDNIVKVEFLDSRALSTKEYDDSFINLLNLKYGNTVDYIVVLDDEAFELVRSNLFNKNSFAYKKPTVFVGVNSPISLTKEESEYITGVLEYQDNLLMINTILKSSKKDSNIYLLLDKSIYSQTIGENVARIVNIADRPYNLNIIEETYFKDIEDRIKEINPKNSAIYLCGVYKNSITGESLNAEEVIENIKELTDAPIYTKLDEYIKAGAIGGIVNDGYKLGIMTHSILESIIEGRNIYTIVPPHDTFNKPVFNYKSIREYNINPLKLPEDSVFINKKPYNLLLPKYMIIIIWGIIITAIVTIILLIHISLVNKKKASENNLLLLESIEREKIRTDFVVTISHELRTPLNIILNTTNLLKLKLDNDEFEKDSFNDRLEIIMKNSQRLRRYISNLIDVSKLELGYMDTNFTNENIVSIVEDVTLTIVDLANEYNIEVIFDTEEEEIITAIDVIKIERVILNLLSNSIKFTQDGGKILVDIKKNNNNVIIEVSDNGSGMPKELTEFIFEKFKRGDFEEGLSRQYEGSGLGLFIVKGLVKLHNGHIAVESKEGEGTRFTIELPIVRVEKDKEDNILLGNSLEYMFKLEFSDIDKKE